MDLRRHKVPVHSSQERTNQNDKKSPYSNASIRNTVLTVTKTNTIIIIIGIKVKFDQKTNILLNLKFFQ